MKGLSNFDKTRIRYYVSGMIMSLPPDVRTNSMIRLGVKKAIRHYREINDMTAQSFVEGKK